MMTEENWKKLRETFDDESKFEKFTEEYGDETWTEEWYTTGIPGDLGIAADLYDWLECSSVRPSSKMIQEFREHGYSVRRGDGDSFGWLTGVVTDLKTGRKICFG